MLLYGKTDIGGAGLPVCVYYIINSKLCSNDGGYSQFHL
jgi:hypothetical protein